MTISGLSLEQPVLWAESKRGKNQPVDDSFVQLVLTIGKNGLHEKYPAPNYLCAFDSEKMAFIPYCSIMSVFSQNDFNWNVAPSNHGTKEFRQLKEMVCSSLKDKYVFYFSQNGAELKEFIRKNLRDSKANKVGLVEITPNNVVYIFNNWLKTVWKTIDIKSWDELRKENITEADFFLAGLISENNRYLEGIKGIRVRLNIDHYELTMASNPVFGDLSVSIGFKDGQKAQKAFWQIYKRPPTQKHCDEILSRRDLLVPQDFRERKGAFFTPAIWVEKSQQYIADVLGDDWQDKYYIWDCCAGTGNLLNGLKDRYRIWASTLDESDVRIMKERIKSNSANLLESHVFQFDFLNDDMNSEKVPESLRKILNDTEKRKHLVIYINPPYAEASDAKTLKKVQGKRGVEQSKVNKQYKNLLGQANAELFAQFLIRTSSEIKGCRIAQFSKLKHIMGPHFSLFRQNFKSYLKSAFLVPAKSFDNVAGDFPIGFFVWDTNCDVSNYKTIAKVYDRDGRMLGMKEISDYDNNVLINDWIKAYRLKDKSFSIGKFPFKGNDFQHQNYIQIVSPDMEYSKTSGQFLIGVENIDIACVYFAVRKCVKKTWLNDRDQFLAPKDDFYADKDFIFDCVIWALFGNYIKSKFGTNHWIPFREEEVNAMECFSSHIIYDNIKSRISSASIEARSVLDAGKELWRYYNSFANENADASLQDIKQFFQGMTDGKLNNIKRCSDNKYILLTQHLNDSMKVLAKKIEAKVYEHGFLLKSDIDMNDDVG